MTVVLTWLLKNWKIIAVIVAAIAAVSWFSHVRYNAGEEAGRAAVQKDWDKETSTELKAATEAAERTAQTERDQAIKAKEIQDGLQAKLDAASADARSLSERLRYYQARRCPNPVSQVPGTAPVVDSTPGVAADSGAIGEATDAHFAACARDAERLGGWQRWYESVN